MCVCVGVCVWVLGQGGIYRLSVGGIFYFGWEIEGEDTTVRTVLNIVRALL